MLGEGDRIQKAPEFRAGDSGDSEFSAPGWLVDSLFFPTRQLRVSRFYQSCPSPPSFPSPFLLPASNRNRELQISVGTAGPQPQTPDLSGHCRTQPRFRWGRSPAASARSQWALPDLNCEFWNSRLGFGALAVPTEIWRLRWRSVRQCPWRGECQNRRQT